jgi:hypothetical protein
MLGTKSLPKRWQKAEELAKPMRYGTRGTHLGRVGDAVAARPSSRATGSFIPIRSSLETRNVSQAVDPWRGQIASGIGGPPESQVRIGLAAGRRWIRTISPWRDGAGYIAEGELRGDRRGSQKFWRGTDGSNPSPSSGESGTNRAATWLRQLGNGTRLIIVCSYACMLQCAHTKADGSAPCKGDHIHDDRCSDRH